MRFFAITLLVAFSATAQPVDAYKHVARLHWIVSDVDRTAEAWRKIGVPVEEAATAEFRTSTGPAESALCATGHFANLRVDWIQPAGADSLPGRFLRDHGQASSLSSTKCRTPPPCAGRHNA